MKTLEKITIGVMIGVLIMSVAVGVQYYQKHNSFMDAGTFKIPMSDYKVLTEPLPQGTFLICDMENNKCATGAKINLKP